MKKLLYFIPSLFIMLLIFHFSSQEAALSSSVSSSLGTSMYEIVEKVIPTLSYASFHTFLRKFAHFSIYFILALTLLFAFYKNKKKGYLATFIISFLYACSDELHQLFVDGRSGELRDVLIDSAGALLAITIVYFVVEHQLHKKIKIPL